MRQFLVRLLAFLVVILLIFGLYRLITVQPLKPSDFFAQATKAPLVIADTGRPTQAPPYTLAALDAAQQAGADGLYFPVQLTRDRELVILIQTDLSQLTERNEPVSQFDSCRRCRASTPAIASILPVMASFPGAAKDYKY